MNLLFEALRFGVLHIDSGWLLGYANRGAHRILEEGDALRLTDGRVEFRRTVERERAARWIEQDCGLNDQVPLVVPRSTGRAPYLMYCLATEPVGSGQLQRQHVLMLLDPHQAPRATPGVLMQAFELTRAEANLAAALANGESLGDFSARVGITVGTARRHLERVFIKIGVDRQAEVVRVVLSCAAPLIDREDAGTAKEK